MCQWIKQPDGIKVLCTNRAHQVWPPTEKELKFGGRRLSPPYIMHLRECWYHVNLACGYFNCVQSNGHPWPSVEAHYNYWKDLLQGWAYLRHTRARDCVRNLKFQTAGSES